MDIAFDRKSWTSGPAGPADGKTGSPEWHGLRARLAAARAARLALAEGPDAAQGVGSGSFNGVSARVLADYDAQLTTVNRVFWANGKPAQSMEAEIADETSPGDRG